MGFSGVDVVELFGSFKFGFDLCLVYYAVLCV